MTLAVSYSMSNLTCAAASTACKAPEGAWCCAGRQLGALAAGGAAVAAGGLQARPARRCILMVSSYGIGVLRALVET